jgi:hypothetical protein
MAWPAGHGRHRSQPDDDNPISNEKGLTQRPQQRLDRHTRDSHRICNGTSGIGKTSVSGRRRQLPTVDFPVTADRQHPNLQRRTTRDSANKPEQF